MANQRFVRQIRQLAAWQRMHPRKDFTALANKILTRSIEREIRTTERDEDEILADFERVFRNESDFQIT